MKVTLLALPLVGQRFDAFGSIPAMPTALPPLAASLRKKGHRVQIVDGFGEAMHRRFRPGPGLVAHGLAPHELAARIDAGVGLVGLSVHSIATDTVARQTIAAIRERLPSVKVVVGGAHPSLMPDRFLEAGAHWVVRGAGDIALTRLIDENPAAGLIEAPSLDHLDELPLPDFEVLPLRRYWALGLGHGPVKGPYLNISTSRGCGQGCTFCSTPALSKGRWRGMSPSRVVELLESSVRHLGVTEFHVEDDDFSADPDRVARICDLILKKELRLRLALPSGLRAASLDIELVRLLARAGCRYMSLAPESGSRQVLRAMNKVVELDHLRNLAGEARRCGIRVGCFVIVGHPSEGPRQRHETARQVEKLIAAGVDDLSIFIWSPLPGAADFGLERGYQRLEQLCWTPRWRARYGIYEGTRIGLYLRAFSTMVRTRPQAVAESFVRLLQGQGSFETKSEMTMNRVLRWRS